MHFDGPIVRTDTTRVILKE